MNNYLKSTLGDCIEDLKQNSSNNFHLVVKKEKLSEVAAKIYTEPDFKTSFITLLGADERSLNDNFKVYVVLFVKEYAALVTLEVHLGKENLNYPAVSLKKIGRAHV